MKNRLDRTLVWFQDGENRIHKLGNDFFGLLTMFNRLMNENYDGRKIQFINIYFHTKEVYIKFPALKVNHVHYYGGGGGHLAYYGEIDIQEFNSLGEEEKKNFVWKKIYEYLQICAKTIKNNNLLEASEYAYKKGLLMKLNPDFRIIDINAIIHNQEMKVSLWINFKNDRMISTLTLEKDGVIIFEKKIDDTDNGVEFFLVMYKSIEIIENVVIIKGRKDVKYLPLKIPILKEELYISSTF